MKELQVIRNIEKKIGFSLQQLTWQEFQTLGETKRKKDRIKKRNIYIHIRRKPERLFVLDDQGNVIVLWLDQSPQPINEELKQLKHLKHLLLEQYQISCNSSLIMIS